MDADTSPRTLRLRRRTTAMAGAIALLLVPATSAAASTAARPPRPTPEQQKLLDLQAQRSQVRAEKAKKAAKVDALKATDSQIKAALADLSDNVSSTTQRLEDAQRAADQAETDKANALAAEQSAADQLAKLKKDVRQQAIDAYVNGSGDESWTILSAKTADEATSRKTMLEFRSSRSLDSIENFRSIQEDLANARSAAADASARATRHTAEVNSHLDELQAAQDEQEKFATQVDGRINAELAEADSLASIDSTLSGQIVSQQSALAAELASRRARDNAAQAALTRSGRSARASADPNVPATTFTNSGGAGIVSVQGIQVSSQIAANLGALLDAARAAGINFGGGGYRDPAAQVALRRAHCGSSNYSIYQAPATSCSPPTAAPGHSMHEQGLAVDFTTGGSTLTRGSAGFAWMQAHAASYNFYNLPSEPWHWSVNGN